MPALSKKELSDVSKEPKNPSNPHSAGNAVESSEKRYRSKSTPSRGTGGRVLQRSFDERQSQSGNLNTNCGNESSTNIMLRFAFIYPQDLTQFDAHTGMLQLIQWRLRWPQAAFVSQRGGQPFVAS